MSRRRAVSGGRLPKVYPPFSTVHAYHVRWSRDGVWEAVADRLRAMARVDAGHDPDPSASIIDARSVRGASTVTAQTRGYDAGKKISGRKTFGLVDTLGLLIAVVVVVASTSDNTGGIAVFDEGRAKTSRLEKLWCDSGFKNTFVRHCQRRGGSMPRSCGASTRTRSWSSHNGGSSTGPGRG